MNFDFKRFSPNKEAILIAVVFTLAYLLTFDHFNVGYSHDEARNLLVSRSISQTGVPTFLGYNFYLHPPLFYSIIAALAHFVHIYVAGAVVVLGFSFLSVFFMYKLSHDIAGKKLARVATLFFAVNPIIWRVSNRFLHETSIQFFFIFSMYLLLRVKRRENMRLWVLLGVVLGLAIFNKIQHFLLIPIVLLFLLLDKRILYFKRKKMILNTGVIKALIVVFVIAGIIYLPWFYYKVINNAPPELEMWRGEISGDVTWSPDSARPFYYFLQVLPEFVTIPLVPLLFLGFYFILSEKERRFSSVLIWFLVVVLFFSIFAGLKNIEIFQPCLAAAIMIAAYGFTRLEKHIGRDVFWALFIGIFVYSAYLSLSTVLYDNSLSVAVEFFDYLRSLDTDGVLVAGPHWGAINLFTEVYTEYLYGDYQYDLGSVIKFNSKYILADDSLAYPSQSPYFSKTQSFPDLSLSIYEVNWTMLTEDVLLQDPFRMVEIDAGVQGVYVFLGENRIGRTTDSGRVKLFITNATITVDLKKICYETESIVIGPDDTFIPVSMEPTSCFYHPDFLSDRY